MYLSKKFLDKYPELEDFDAFVREDHIYLSLIRVKDEFRGRGIAKKAMSELCEIADDLNIPILLTPEPLDGDKATKIGRLKEFYKGFGFKNNKGQIRDYSLPSATMKRLPKDII